MKKLSLLIAALMVCLAASAQSPIKKIMERFDERFPYHGYLRLL